MPPVLSFPQALLVLGVLSPEAHPSAEEPGAIPVAVEETYRDGGQDEPGGWWHGPLGLAEPDRLYGGLWTLHLKRTEDGLSQHYLMALGWRGFIAKTFVNSHGTRSWGLGVGRSVVKVETGPAAFSLGYRAGIMRGYDGKLHDLADRWPVIPAAELVGSARYGRVGVQLTYALIVLSVGGFISLGGGS